MMHTFNPFNPSKAHAIGIHLQAFALDFFGVAFAGFITINELPPTIDTNVMSAYLSFFHFYGYEWSGIQGIAWKITSIHTPIMQRPKKQF